MKRIILTGVAVVAVVLAFLMGRKLEVRHALEDSEMWVLSFDTHDGYDYDINILLDGEWYVHSSYIG